jgi:hypothetical protein
MDKAEDCLLCDPRRADQELGRVEVWSDARWRLTTLVEGEIAGFSVLEPRRHIRHITDMDGAHRVRTWLYQDVERGYAKSTCRPISF